MAEPRLKIANLAWAPRALAVISCALALLAAQPAAQAGTLKTRAVAVRDGAAGASLMAGEVVARRSPVTAVGSRAARGGRMETSLLASASRLHILATMEILHRLLISELRTPERQMMPMVWFQPLCLTEIPAPAVQRPGRMGELFTPPPVMERAFAIEHCLLAPPIG